MTESRTLVYLTKRKRVFCGDTNYGEIYNVDTEVTSALLADQPVVVQVSNKSMGNHAIVKGLTNPGDIANFGGYHFSKDEHLRFPKP